MEKASDGTAIDYAAAIEGELCLVPGGKALEALEDDYRRMVDDGLLLEGAESSGTLMERCSDVAERANRC
ncbi:MAG TPA: hypothetical protein VFQ34_11820 [Nitrospiraceae bacterium]|nr:hypothetical protein [Nitrospiraceae bacterium]